MIPTHLNTSYHILSPRMEQEWMRSALLHMKALMQKAIGDLATVQQTVERRNLWAPHHESESRLGRQNTRTALNRQLSTKSMGGRTGRRQESKHSSASNSSSSDELLATNLHDHHRTNLKTSERALTLEQLKTIDQELERWCRGWTDAFTGATISADTLNLYHFSYHHILPQTAPIGGVLLQWPASLVLGKDLPEVGSEVHQKSSQMKLSRAKGKVISAKVDAEDGIEMLTLCIRLVQGQFVSSGFGTCGLIVC